MKIISIFLSFLILTTAIIIANPTIGTARAFSRKPPTVYPFKDTAGWNKIDLRLREAWRDSMKKGNGAKYLECIMKALHPMSKDEKEQLKDAGFEYRNVIGAIATGRLMAKDVPQVSNLNFIQAMELATPLSLKVK